LTEEGQGIDRDRGIEGLLRLLLGNRRRKVREGKESACSTGWHLLWGLTGTKKEGLA